MPTAIDLFSGCGGLTEGLKQAQFQVRCAVEIEELAAETYRLNHPEVHVWTKDIRELTEDEIRGHLADGPIDLVAGCPPCEGFSRLRSKNGRHSVEDPRNDLIYEWLRIVRLLRPTAVMLENVPELAEDPRFVRTVRSLRGMRYRVKWDILDAADYGVPQRRKRLILVGGRGASPTLPSPERGQRRVRDAIAGLPPAGRSGDPAHDMLMRNGSRIRALIEAVPADGGSRGDLPDDVQLDCHREFDGFSDVYGRMSWNRVAPTITGGCASPSKGRFLHPSEHRVITIREAALLQSFPRTYSISMRRGRYAAAEMIGNALPPLLIRRVASAVRERFLPGAEA